MTILRLCLTILILASSISLTYSQIRGEELMRSSPIYDEWGVTAGLNMQQLIAFPFDRNFGTGALAGVYYKKTKKIFALQAGLGATTAQYQTDAAIYDTAINVSAVYLTLPLTAEIKTSKKLALQTGVSFQYLLSANSSSDAKVGFDDKKLFKNVNLYLQIGAEYMISKKLAIGGRFGMGMLNQNNNGITRYSDTWLATNGQLSLKYMVRKLYPKYQLKAISVRKR